MADPASAELIGNINYIVSGFSYNYSYLIASTGFLLANL